MTTSSEMNTTTTTTTTTTMEPNQPTNHLQQLTVDGKPQNQCLIQAHDNITLQVGNTVLILNQEGVYIQANNLQTQSPDSQQTN